MEDLVELIILMFDMFRYLYICFEEIGVLVKFERFNGVIDLMIE